MPYNLFANQTGPIPLSELDSNFSQAVQLINLASNAIGSGAALIGWPAGFGITQPATNQFFTQNNAAIQRLNDRVFIAGATVNDGVFPTVVKDWLTQMYDANGYTQGYTLNGQVSVLSSASSASAEMIVSGTQSLNFTGNSSFGAGVVGVGVNNNPTFTTAVNAFYGEVHNLLKNTDSAYVCEFDTRTLADPSVPSPFTQGTVVGIQLASGAGTTGVTVIGSISGTALTVSSIVFALPYGNIPASYQIGVGSLVYGAGVSSGTSVTALGTGTGGVGTYTVNNSQTVSSRTLVATDQYNASCALQVAANPVKFKVGINFLSTSLDGCDGINGSATAVSLALGHQLTWFNSSGSVIGRVYSVATTQANTGEVIFSDQGIELRSYATGGQPIAFFQGVANGVNWVTVNNGVTGSGPSVSSNGSDANIDLKLLTKGTGVLSFGTFTTSAVSQTGYITVKDSSGTLRRLLVG